MLGLVDCIAFFTKPEKIWKHLQRINVFVIDGRSEVEQEIAQKLDEVYHISIYLRQLKLYVRDSVEFKKDPQFERWNQSILNDLNVLAKMFRQDLVMTFLEKEIAGHIEALGLVTKNPTPDTN